MVEVYGGLAVRFPAGRTLEVQFADTPPVGLRDGDEVVGHLRLLALPGQVPEQVRDVAATVLTSVLASRDRSSR